MREFYTKSSAQLGFQIVLLLGLSLLGWYSAGCPEISRVSLLLFGSALAIGLAGLVFGLLAGLWASLAAIFLFGTLILCSVFITGAPPLSARDIVLWMTSFVLMAVVSGMPHKWIVSILEENRRLKEKFDTLVTIDEATGFDNRKRFFLAMEEEFKRSKRTGIPFALAIFQIRYFNKFRELYGETEMNHLLGSVAAILRDHTRLTDGKFRIADDTFAIILTNTIAENAAYVMAKIEDLLKVHVLANKKKAIMLTIAFGISNYSDKTEDYTEMIRHASLELDHYVQ